MRSKEALDKIINKSRVHLYKPIQIAEILYHYRHGEKIDLKDLQSYRNISKKWRDDMTIRLVGRRSTSSQKYQDDVFNAMPPELLYELGEYNKKSNGIVENYIYHRLKERLKMVSEALEYINNSGVKSFELDTFLSRFIQKKGLKRSIDKVYEIVVYALFSTLVRALEVEISLSVKNKDKQILSDFGEFIELVIGLPKGKTSMTMYAKLFRVGVTNAADRGLDMWSNFGPAVQVKHVSLSQELVEEVAENITADKIVLICSDGEKELIRKLTTQLPNSKIQGIITIGDLRKWYKLCLSAKYQKVLGEKLLQDLIREFGAEFPVGIEITSFLKERKYDILQLKGEWSL